MPQGWTAVPDTSAWKPVSSDSPRRDESVGAARLRGFKEGATEGASDLYAGTKEGLGAIAQMLRHPIDTAAAMGSGALEAARAVPDVARNLSRSDTRGATARGFAQGATEGAAGVDHDASFSRKVGQFVGGTVIPAVATAGTVRGVRIARAGGAPRLVVETAGKQEIGRFKGGKPIRVVEPDASAGPTTSRIPYTAQESQATAPKASPNAGGRVVAGGERASVPPTTNLAKAITEGLQQTAEPAHSTQAARRAPRITKVADQPVAVSELPTSWRRLVDTPASSAPVTAAPASAPVVQNVPGIITKRTPKPGAVETARAALGAREAGNIFGMTAQEVRQAAPGASRRPLKAQMADLDADYLRRIQDERGFANQALLRTLGLATGGGVAGSLAADDSPLAGALAGALGGAAVANPITSLKAIQQARMIGMLSGAALPKSLAGNAGAVLTAAAEKGSIAPIREALRLPTNLKNAARGFASGTHPDSGPIGKVNIIGRAMQGMDDATMQALQRAGLSTPEAQRLLLTEPNPLGTGTFGKAMQSGLGRAVMPFQRIPFNSAAQGVNSLTDLAPGSGASAMRRALTVGAGAAGAAAGSQTDNPILLALIAALAGPRQIPFALGAGVTAGPKVIERVGGGIPDASWKDLFDPLRPIDKPALMRLIEELQK